MRASRVCVLRGAGESALGQPSWRQRGPPARGAPGSSTGRQVARAQGAFGILASCSQKARALREMCKLLGPKTDGGERVAFRPCISMCVLLDFVQRVFLNSRTFALRVATIKSFPDALTLKISFSYSASPKCSSSQPARGTANVKCTAFPQRMSLYMLCSVLGHGEFNEQNGQEKKQTPSYRSDVWMVVELG